MKSIGADYYVIKSSDLTELKTKIAVALGEQFGLQVMMADFLKYLMNVNECEEDLRC
jgi:hypothetical protein